MDSISHHDLHAAATTAAPSSVDEPIAATAAMPTTLAHALRPQADTAPEPDPVSDDEGDQSVPTTPTAAELPQRFAAVVFDDATNVDQPRLAPLRRPLTLNASGDALSVSTHELAQAFTPVYRRRMVSSFGASRSGEAAGRNPFSVSFGSGGGGDGSATEVVVAAQRRPSSPTAGELASAITPAYRTTPFGTSVRTLSPATQARVKDARRRARQLRKSLGRTTDTAPRATL